MGRKIQDARYPSGELASVLAVAYTAGQTFKRGALLTYVAAGTVSECGADPAKVAGVALQDAASGLGFDMANSPSVFTGRNTEVSMAVADRITVFSMRAVNGATDPVTPLQTHISESYGVIKTGNDWVLDIAEVTATIFTVVDIDADNKVFFCKFIESRLDLP